MFFFSLPPQAGGEAKLLSSWGEFSDCITCSSRSHRGCIQHLWHCSLLVDHKVFLFHSSCWVIGVFFFFLLYFLSKCFGEDGCTGSDILSISAEMWGFCSNGRCRVYDWHTNWRMELAFCTIKFIAFALRGGSHSWWELKGLGEAACFDPDR